MLSPGRIALVLCAPVILVASIAPAAGARTDSRRVAANGCHITQARSLNGNHPTSIEFVNNTRGAVRIVWVDYAGKLVLYNTLPSRSFSVQPTYSTHVWIVLDSAWKCIGYVVAPKRVYEIR